MAKRPIATALAVYLLSDKKPLKRLELAQPSLTPR
jgi:hypothetical protein